MMATFFTPDGNTGSAELTVSNGLTVTSQGLWQFSQSGYNDGATFGLSLTHPKPLDGGTLRVQAQNWPIAVVGNELTDYIGTGSEFYPASQCRIQIRGQWRVIRQQNSNSFNSFGVEYHGATDTDLGNRAYWGTWFTVYQSYVIQGADVVGGAQDTFSGHFFYCQSTETATTDNSNRLFQSNTIVRPVWYYTYSKSWQVV